MAKMKKGWEANTRLSDAQVRIEWPDGETLLVTDDGTSGYDFAVAYLEEIDRHYHQHLVATYLILKWLLGKNYNNIRKSPRLYNARLAVRSLNCIFGKYDEVPDYDNEGNFNPEFTHCPFRSECPFNGFNPRNEGKDIVGCNPIYKCGLTPIQARMADLLVNTSANNQDIAASMNCSKSNVDNIINRIFLLCEVNSRPELTNKLKGKRLL